MGRPKEKAMDPEKMRRPGLRVKIYVQADMIGTGKIDLLRRVAETGSISASARSMGMGYRRAWFLLDTLQSCFAEPLFVTVRGGAKSGGTRLTPLGIELLERYAAEEAKLKTAATGFLDWLETRQAVLQSPARERR
jgi:molybdate transport system regulatory protein